MKDNGYAADCEHYIATYSSVGASTHNGMRTGATLSLMLGGLMICI